MNSISTPGPPLAIRSASSAAFASAAHSMNPASHASDDAFADCPTSDTSWVG